VEADEEPGLRNSSGETRLHFANRRDAKFMFDWFRKKPPEPAKPRADASAMLALPNPAFTDLCVKLIRGEQPGANAMVVVAFKVLHVLLPFGAEALRAEGKDNRPDDVFRLCFDNFMSETDDVVNQRRRKAFLRALLFHDLMRREGNDPALYSAVVGIWIELANSGVFLRNLLERTIVWSDDEKIYFKDFKTDDDIVDYIVNFIVPPRYRSHHSFQDLGRKHNFLVFP
jgi:hypothetical protein